jgi:hypothetical protein
MTWILILFGYVLPGVFSAGISKAVEKLDNHPSHGWLSEWKHWFIPVVNWAQPFLFMAILIEFIWVRTRPGPREDEFE